VLTPPALWRLLRRRPAGADFASPAGSLAALTIVPLLLFAALSAVKTIGLHWVLAFVPFALLGVALRLTPDGLRRLVKFFAGFALLHVTLIVGLALLPLETWRSTNYYSSAVLTFDSRALVERARPGDSLLVSDGYSNAVILGYNLGRYVPVLGLASSHARHDDILTDWRAHAGRDITVLRKTEPKPGEYDGWFRAVETESFDYRGARFWVVRGRGFDYPAYRDGVLAEVRRRYYAVPAWLPLTDCYFCTRYFPAAQCTR